MNEPKEPTAPAKETTSNPPILPHATQDQGDDNPPPLYVSGFGVLGQSTPDVATGSTPVTRRDD